MKRKFCFLFILLLFLFTFGTTKAQSLIYRKIEQEKKEGKKFELVRDFFIKTPHSGRIGDKFKKVEQVVFMKYNTALHDKLGNNITIEIPLKEDSLVLELEAVDNDFYSYTITNEKGEAFPANRSIKHYRGIIKDNKNSSVALSFGKESANGIVINERGNFNISSINETSNVVFFQDDNTIYDNMLICGVTDGNVDGVQSLYETSDITKDFIDFYHLKCLRIYFELRYDMFENFAQISTTDVTERVAGYFSSVFNQVSLLFYNAGIQAYISELKINTAPDPYPLYQTGTFYCNSNSTIANNNNSRCIFNSFGNHLSNNYNGDIAQLVSAKMTTSWGNGVLMYKSEKSTQKLCEVDKKLLYSYAGIGRETDSFNNNFFHNYSWNINVIIHELGHVLGSNHTHSCVWNGNETAIDHCGSHYYITNPTLSPTYYIDGSTCYDHSNPILPQNGGTIMSYCHLLSNVGINFFNGFGEQPKNRIRSKICKKLCIAPAYCFRNMYIGYENNKPATNDYTVPSGHIDNRKVSNDLYAYNTIDSGGKARYSAGKSIRLLPNTVAQQFLEQNQYPTGFHAKAGSDVILKIENCPQMQYTLLSPLEEEPEEELIDNTSHSEEIYVNLYPNPTTGIITIESNYEITFWELTNSEGNLYKSSKVPHSKKIELNLESLTRGIYSIKLHLANNKYSFKNIIKH